MRDQALHLDPEPVTAAARGGDRAMEFDLFFEHERARLFQALCLVSRNRFEAEELAQDAFLAVYERWDRVREMEDPTGYPYRTAMNAFRSWHRRSALAAKRSIGLTRPDDSIGGDRGRVGSMTFRDDGLIDFTDLVVFWSGCARGPVPADTAAFAQAVSADPNFETTAPVAARVGGVEAVAIDVALSPAGRVCWAYRTDGHRWIHALEPGKRLRLFLVDLPEGMSMRTLAITVMAPVARFDDVVADATPIIDSIEFHAP